MHTILIIVLIILGFIALLLIVAFFAKKKHAVKREIVINAATQKVFEYLKILKNQDAFNKNAMADANRKEIYSGIDGTIGFTISWNGNKNVGEGKKEIKNIVEGKSIETEISFVRPMAATATIIIETQSLPNNQTKVIWSNTGILKYPINIFIPMMEKHVAKDMDSSLLTLKNILEKNSLS
jgi:hypothetical protein